MQDEDGYITLNIKPRKKPTLSTADSASSWWRVMALVLLISSMGLIVGLAGLSIMSVTQQKYLLAEKESLSVTLQQLARKFCQELIKQSELKTKATFEHKCSPCASQWRYHGDSCYGFFRQNLTWEESKQYCAERNATLVKAASQKTVEYLAGRITSIRWLGLSRKNSNKDWMWEDSSILPKNVIDLSGNTRENMNCAYLHNGKIRPASCSCVGSVTSLRTFSMHEEEIYCSLQWDSPTPEGSQKCLSPGKCSGTWCVMAVISCVLCVGLLATSIFLGIKFFQVSSLAMNQQERLIQQEKVLLNLTQWQRNYTLQMKNCQALQQSFLNSRSNCNPCPHNWIQNGKSCYYAIQVWNVWNSSKAYCSKRGASLLQIDSKEEMEFIIHSPWKVKGVEYWVGMFQDRLSQAWFWQDGSSPSSDLLPTEQELSTSEICGYFEDNSLFSDKCSSWKYFICEKNAFGSCT